MAKPICLVKDPSGLYEKDSLKILPYYLYEVRVNKYWNLGYCLIGKKFYKSDTPLTIKYGNIIKYSKNFIIEKEVFLVGAPIEYLKDLPVYELNVKKKKFKKNERAR